MIERSTGYFRKISRKYWRPTEKSPRKGKSTQVHGFWRRQNSLQYAAPQLPYHLADCNNGLTTDAVNKFLGSLGNITSYLQVLHHRDWNIARFGRGNGDSDQVEWNGEPLNFNNYPKERSSFHIAAALGHLPVFRQLLELGTDISARDSYGWTALHSAAWGGHEEVVHLLLETGADCSLQERTGDTALHIAATEGHEAVTRLLLESGADHSIPEMHGWAPLYLAVIEDHAAIVQLLLEKGADISATDNYGDSMLCSAASDGHESVVNVLLENGADISATSNAGVTALHMAASNGHEAG